MANQTLSSRLNVGVANIVVPGTSSGLVSASGLPGNTTGNAIASGYVGEQQLVNNWNGQTSLSSGTAYNVTSLSLPAGVWLVFGSAEINATTGTDLYNIQLSISTTTATRNNSAISVIAGTSGTALLSEAVLNVFQYVNVSATTPVYLVGFAQTTASTWSISAGATNSGTGQFYAVRIA